MQQNGTILENCKYDYLILHKKLLWDEMFTILCTSCLLKCLVLEYWIPRFKSTLSPCWSHYNVVVGYVQAMDAVSAAGWPHMKVDPLKESEKLQVVSEYLEGIYGKHLNDDQKDMIVSSTQTNNPLYLKALLDEVGARQEGSGAPD